jgi:hypothetical protein
MSVFLSASCFVPTDDRRARDDLQQLELGSTRSRQCWGLPIFLSGNLGDFEAPSLAAPASHWNNSRADVL